MNFPCGFKISYFAWWFLSKDASVLYEKMLEYILRSLCTRSIQNRKKNEELIEMPHQEIRRLDAHTGASTGAKRGGNALLH